MAPQPAIDAADISAKARRDLLRLLESVRYPCAIHSLGAANSFKIRGKKNLVVQKDLAGTLGLFVKFSTLQEYGIDRVFFLENDNVDSSQKNVVFLARSDKPLDVAVVAGMSRHASQ